MACCLTAPSHYLNQRWLIHWHSSLRAILQKIPQPPIIKISLKMTFLKLLSNLPVVNELKLLPYLPVVNKWTTPALYRSSLLVWSFTLFFFLLQLFLLFLLLLGFSSAGRLLLLQLDLPHLLLVQGITRQPVETATVDAAHLKTHSRSWL